MTARLENRKPPTKGASKLSCEPRIGELDVSTHIGEFCNAVVKSLNPPSLRLVQSGKSQIQKVACVPGSGASYIEAAARAGCDCLVTGDIKHHDALMAQAHGLALVDVTHTATERAAVAMIANALKNLHDVEVVQSEIDTNPFTKLV